MNEICIFIIPFLIGLVITFLIQMYQKSNNAMLMITSSIFIGFKIFLVALIPNIFTYFATPGCQKDIIIPIGCFTSIMALTIVYRVEEKHQSIMNKRFNRLFDDSYMIKNM